MSRRATPAQAAHNQQIIKGLLKLDCNKICADCKRNKRQFLTLSAWERLILRSSLSLGTYLFCKKAIELTQILPTRSAMGILEFGRLYLYPLFGRSQGHGHPY